MKKVALVTGAAGGIGYATAEKLMKDGFAVVGMDIVPVDAVGDKFNGWGRFYVRFRQSGLRRRP